MREIKFRAWDLRANQPRVGYMWTDYDYPIEEIIAVGREPGNILMQFTGLKDKNGKEIYEGDVLRDQWGRRFEVFWMDGITEHDMEAGWWVRKREGDHREIFTMHQWRDNQNLGFEVIGNIYENPALLKD